MLPSRLQKADAAQKARGIQESISRGVEHD
jgi:hypothetical protein